MADYDARFNRLALSAADLKQVTALQKPGEPWPDALIEDYLNILRDLIELAELIDQNAAEIIRGLSAAEQDIGSISSKLSKLYGAIDVVRRSIVKSRQESYQGKDKSMINALKNAGSSIYGNRAFFGIFLGNGAAAPSVALDYNYASISRTGVGAYEVTLRNPTINGFNFASRCVFSHDFKIAGNATSDLYAVEFTPSASSFTVNVYQFTIVGPKLTKTAYDLQTGDILNVMLLTGEGSIYQAL